MTIEINFYFKKTSQGFECTSQLNSGIKGIGKNKEDAEKDYFNTFNKFSKEMKAEVKEILDKKNVSYVMEDYVFTKIN